MEIIKDESELKLTIRRTFSYRRELVFETWTNPSHLKQWFSPNKEIRLTIAEVDLCVGGSYKFGFTQPDTPLHVVKGEFKTVIAPEKLVYTWVWDPPIPEAGKVMLVTVDFIDKGDSTEFVLTHERLCDSEVFEKHKTGWCGAIDRLDELFKSRSS